jgi:hypothetical protein
MVRIPGHRRSLGLRRDVPKRGRRASRCRAADGDRPVTLYYKAIFPDRVETQAVRTRTYAACLLVRWPTAIGADSPVAWFSTREDAGAKAVIERDMGNSADVAAAVEIDATEYRILRAATRAGRRP